MRDALAVKAIRIIKLMLRQMKQERHLVLHRDFVELRCNCGDDAHSLHLTRLKGQPWSTMLLNLLEALEAADQLFAGATGETLEAAEQLATENTDTGETGADALSDAQLRRSVTLFQTGVMLSDHFVDAEA